MEVKTRVATMLSDGMGDLRTRFDTVQELLADGNTQAFLELFKNFGADNRTFPSHVAMAMRILEGENIPSINPIVDIYNSLGLKYFTPFGGEDLEQVYGDLVLKLAQGNEIYIGIGSEKNKPPKEGELAWVDDMDVTCRALNWRQCNRTKITLESKAGYFILDGVREQDRQNIQNASQELVNIIIELFGAEARILYLDKDNPEAGYDFQTKQITSEQKLERVKQFNLKAKQTPQAEKLEKEQKVYVFPANSIASKIQQMLSDAVCEKYGIALCSDEIHLETPADEAHGDYASNIAMGLAKQLARNPRDIAFELAKCDVQIANSEELSMNNEVRSAICETEVAGPGFLNFRVSKHELVDNLTSIIENKQEYGKQDWGKDKTWLIEHTSPNPNKAMHIGHLRNNLVGMAISNIWEEIGVNVIRDAIDNNRGIAIAKLMWGYLKFAWKNYDGNTTPTLEYWLENQHEWKTPEEEMVRPDKFMDQLYVKGAEDFKNPDIEIKVRQIVIDWEAKEAKTWALWEKVLNYVYEGQKRTLERLGSEWDKVWHEHEIYEKGKEVVNLGLQRGIFRKLDDGAVLTNLEQYGIPDTIVIKKDGTSLYITQDLELTRLKLETFKPDKAYWVVGSEQSLALKQVFAASEQLGFANIDQLEHIAYGYLTIKGQGKMSSRMGNVIYIDDLIDTAKDEIRQIMIESKRAEESEVDFISEKVALGAIKYSILKVGRLTDISFDLESSISFDGDSGPYIMYTFARCMSIIKDRQISVEQGLGGEIGLNTEGEIALVRQLNKYTESILNAGIGKAPNILCIYLYNLAQKFNNFYTKHSILNAESDDQKQSRLLLTQATAIVLKNGLEMLGIDTVERM